MMKPASLPVCPEAFPSIFRLDGKTALITGGGSGLGLAIATGMARAGARVILVGRRQPELEAACAAIGEAATFHVFDVTQTACTPDFAAEISRREGPVSILVNNAGIHLKKPAGEITPEEFDRVWQTHVAGAFALARAFYPGMRDGGGGSILFTSSMAALFGIPLVAAYSAAKTALTGLVRGLAVEWGPSNVRVNAIAPGWIESDMMWGALRTDPARQAKILSRTPLGAFGQATDIGWAAVYLSSPAARFVTGTVIPVDGGASIGF